MHARDRSLAHPAPLCAFLAVAMTSPCCLARRTPTAIMWRTLPNEHGDQSAWTRWIAHAHAAAEAEEAAEEAAAAALVDEALVKVEPWREDVE
jgi:hypothetical protein